MKSLHLRTAEDKSDPTLRSVQFYMVSMSMSTHRVQSDSMQENHMHIARGKEDGVGVGGRWVGHDNQGRKMWGRE